MKAMKNAMMKVVLKMREGVAMAEGIWFFGPRPEK